MEDKNHVLEWDEKRREGEHLYVDQALTFPSGIPGYIFYQFFNELR